MSRYINDNDNPDNYVNNTKAFISHQSTATRAEWDDIVSTKWHIKAAHNAYLLTPGRYDTDGKINFPSKDID